MSRVILPFLPSRFPVIAVTVLAAMAGASCRAAWAEPAQPKRILPAHINPNKIVPKEKDKISAGARAALDAMVAAYKSIDTYSGTVTLKTTGFALPPDFTAKIRFGRQARFNVSSSNAEGTSNIVSDGETVWYTIARARGQYIKDPAPPTKDALKWVFKEIGGDTLTLLPLLIDIDPLSIYGEALKSATLDDGSKAPQDAAGDADVVVVEFGTGRDSGTVTYVIGKGDHLLRQVSVTETAGKSTVSVVETYSETKINSALPDSDFRLNTAGLELVENFPLAPWNPRLKIGGDPLPIPLADTRGKPVSFEEYKGKVLLLDFWASWCPPCAEDAPEVRGNYEEFKDEGFEIVGISMDVDRQSMNAFIEAHRQPWRQVFDGRAWDGPTARLYSSMGIPFTVVIGRDGKVAAINARGDRLRYAIERALYGERTMPNELELRGTTRLPMVPGTAEGG